jgi:hypothetical protein
MSGFQVLLPPVGLDRSLFFLGWRLTYLTLCGPVANLLAFGFLNMRTGSQLFGF